MECSSADQLDQDLELQLGNSLVAQLVEQMAQNSVVHLESSSAVKLVPELARHSELLSEVH